MTKVSANGLQIEVDDQGLRDDPTPLLLIMGLGMQLVAWPEGLVKLLTDAGRRVIRFDNRDAGLSDGFDDRGLPNLVSATLRYWLRLPVPSAYRIEEMAADAFGVLDALGVQRAQVVGASMGGMVAQHMAAQQPERVARLLLMMTSSGARHLPQASAKVRRALMRRPPTPGDRQAVVDRIVSLFDLIGSPAYKPDAAEFRRRVEAMTLRAHRPAGILRQLVAVVADGDRSPMLERITAPTHIVHGGADPLIPVAAAHDLQAKIRGATLEVIPGMGHDLPPALWPRFAQAMLKGAG
jgi:pimeloyl-ACP methyl ester carboxylesterase